MKKKWLSLALSFLLVLNILPAVEAQASTIKVASIIKNCTINSSDGPALFAIESSGYVEGTTQSNAIVKDAQVKTTASTCPGRGAHTSVSITPYSITYPSTRVLRYGASVLNSWNGYLGYSYKPQSYMNVIFPNAGELSDNNAGATITIIKSGPAKSSNGRCYTYRVVTYPCSGCGGSTQDYETGSYTEWVSASYSNNGTIVYTLGNTVSITNCTFNSLPSWLSSEMEAGA